MSEETLHTAARRVVRFFNIDLNKGGLITEETQKAVETLTRMVELENRNESQRRKSIDLAEGSRTGSGGDT